MKKSVVLALVLSALLLVTVMAVSVSADASLTLGEITFVKDAANGLVTFTVPYTASEVDQVTVIAVKGPASAAPAPTEANIVYFNQQAASVGSFTFSVVDDFDATNPYCWIKIGGTSIANASGEGEEIWTEAAPVLVYGDVNGDELVDAVDVILVTKYAAATAAFSELDATEFPNGTFPTGSIDAADVNGDDVVDAADVVLLSKYAAAMASSSELDTTEFPGGKFPAESN